jgi:hypothetical protein
VPNSVIAWSGGSEIRVSFQPCRFFDSVADHKRYRAREGWGRQLAGILSGHVRLVASLFAVLACAAVHAEDLDQGKSPQKLFADSCAACHKSARGLTKRGYLTLYFFLKDHYASNSTSAWALTSYLESVEDTPRGRSKQTAGKTPPRPQATSGTPPRPPEAVPKR